MKNIIIFLLLISSCISCYCQSTPSVECKSFAVDTAKVLEIMKKGGYLSNETSHQFHLIYPLELIVDTLQNQIYYKIDEDKPLVYFPFVKGKTQFYQSFYNFISVQPRTNENSFYMAISQAFRRNPDCIYTLQLFPYPNMEDAKQYQMVFFRTADGQEYIFDERFRYFKNLTEMLEYKFGSVENYIETYKKRFAYLKRQAEEQRKQNEGKQRGFRPTKEDIEEWIKMRKGPINSNTIE